MLAQLLSARAIGAGGLGFKSRVGQIANGSAPLRRSIGAGCTVAQALCREDGPLFSSHASAYYREYNKGLTCGRVILQCLKSNVQ